MSDKEIFEGNKFIGKFAGMIFLHTSFDSHNFEQYAYSLPDYLSLAVYGFKNAETFLSDEQFAKSYDWIMPVVFKFRDLVITDTDKMLAHDYWVKKLVEAIKHGDNEDKPLKVFVRMIEAINWYNQLEK